MNGNQPRILEDAEADVATENQTTTDPPTEDQGQLVPDFKFAQFPGAQDPINHSGPIHGGFFAIGGKQPGADAWIPEDDQMFDQDEISKAIERLGFMDYKQDSDTVGDHQNGRNEGVGHELLREKVAILRAIAPVEEKFVGGQNPETNERRRITQEDIENYLLQNSGIPHAPASEYFGDPNIKEIHPNSSDLEHLDHRVDIFNNEYDESTHWDSQEKKILSLPHGVITLILAQICFTGHKHDISNFLSTCRRLYYGHPSKVYWGRSIKFEEIVQRDGSCNVEMNPALATNIFRFENNSAFYDITTSIHINSLIHRHQLGLRTRFLTYLPPMVQHCGSLLVLNVNTNSLKVLASLLKILPQHLQKVVLKLTLSNKRQLQGFFSEEDFVLPSRPRPTKLFKFHFDVVHFQWSTSPESLKPPETSPGNGSAFLKRLAGDRNSARLKAIRLGRMIYQILDASKNTLLFIKIKRFDLGFIYNPYTGSVPPVMPETRVYWFDSASDLTYRLWLPGLLTCLTLQGYKGILGPIVVYYNNNKDQLYTYELQNDTLPPLIPGKTPMSCWREIGHSIRESFQQQLELEYDFHGSIG